MTDFNGKVALVTGGGTGIGQATAVAFAKKGAKVVVSGRRAEQGEETVNLIKKIGGEALFIPTDVTQSAEVKRLIQTTVQTFGRLDYAFNNAGTEGKPGALHELSEEDWHLTFDANVKGVWLSMKYEIEQMLKQEDGVIINNASIVAHIGMPNMAAYAASKHAVLGLTKSAALEYAKTGIRINSVSPGPIFTPMAVRGFGSQETFNSIMGNIAPLGRVGNPQEIAEAVLWLCSDSATFAIGTDIILDGGIVAQ
jgi:NAD(P)-dependent dehydrogenase (short-subunit alcohol dehydrogenase family)